MVSHELKTPITSLSAYLQLLELHIDNNFEPKFSKIISNATRQVKKMLSMVNGFMSVSRMENSQILIDKTRFDLVVTLHRVVEETLTLHPEREIIINVPEHPVEVTADFERIEQVIGNLMSNAVKYSPRESLIEVNCLISKNLASLSIFDKGPGISKDNIRRVFNKYYRVENQFSKTSGGFGIGLYFCSEIMKLHGGNVWAESVEGNGSTFILTLPV